MQHIGMDMVGVPIRQDYVTIGFLYGGIRCQIPSVKNTIVGKEDINENTNYAI